MTTNQTIYGVPRSLLQSLYTDTVQQWGVGGNAASQLRALLGAPATWLCNPCKAEQPTDRACDVCGGQTKPSAQPQADTVAFPRELSDELGELIAEKARVCGGGAFEIWEAICERFGTQAEQPAPVAVVLPERLDMTDGLHSYEYVTGHNAEIDKMRVAKS